MLEMSAQRSAGVVAVLLAICPALPPSVGSQTAVGATAVKPVLLQDAFGTANGPNSLITNEYAHWNPGDSSAVRSPIWDMTSGSVFAQSGAGWSGRPDACAPDRYSQTCTNSAVFRLTTKRSDFGDVRVDARIKVNSLSSTASTPGVAWDGIHIWVRYQSEESVYYASVDRRDGVLVIKKKCPGGPSNGGTYYQLASRAGYPIPYGTWQRIGVSAANSASGAVTIRIYREGSQVLTATDTGTGCAVISAPGATGVRADNADFNVDDFVVSRGQ